MYKCTHCGGQGKIDALLQPHRSIEGKCEELLVRVKNECVGMFMDCFVCVILFCLWLLPPYVKVKDVF